MRALKYFVVVSFIVVMATTLAFRQSAQIKEPSESAVDRVRRDRFQPKGQIEKEASTAPDGEASLVETEAPAAFDNRTNGFLPQGPAFDTIGEDNVVPLASFNDDR